MNTHRTLTALGLALCLAAAATTPSALASGAKAIPNVTVAGHVSTYWTAERTSPQARFVQQLTLRVTGSNFAPGRLVRLAIIDTTVWRTLARGSAHAQPATITEICGRDFQTCTHPNPKAGTITYRVRLYYAPPAADLMVAYRSTGAAGMQNVTLQ